MSLYCSTVMERLEMRWKGGQDQFYTLVALSGMVISVCFEAKSYGRGCAQVWICHGED